MLGRIGAEDGAGAAAVHIFRLGVGVAGLELPVRQQFAGNLHLDAPRLDLAQCDVVAIGVLLGPVLVGQMKIGDRAVERAAEELALEADFVLIALPRIEQITTGVEIGLRLEYLGVAGIGRDLIGQIDHRSEIGSKVAVDLDLVLRGAGEKVLRRRIVPADAPAADQRHPVDRLDAQLSVDAGLALVAVSLAGVVDGRLGDGRGVPVVEIVGAGDHAGGREERRVDLAVVGAEKHVVLLAEQHERLGDKGVESQ